MCLRRRLTALSLGPSLEEEDYDRLWKAVFKELENRIK